MKKLILFLLLSVAQLACSTKQAQPGYIVQVSLGSWHSPDYSARQIIGRIDTVSTLIPVEKVIIGWSVDKEIYKEVGVYLHSKGIKMLLWMPVFAETEEMCENSPAVDLWGNIPSNYDLAAGEGFRFNCPSDPRNAANVVAIYDNYFSDCGFDGVFLDRIRTQSFVSGVGGVLNCGCPLCVEKFRAEGMDLDFLNSQLEAMEPYSCAKYPGIEINYREGVAPTSPEYVTESLKAAMGHGFNGAVLSWNIMEAPVAHIDCLRN